MTRRTAALAASAGAVVAAAGRATLDVRVRHAARKRHDANRALDAIDAALARHVIDDGTLYDLDPDEDGTLAGIALLRRRAVLELEAAGGHDPHPTFAMRLTPAQARALIPNAIRRAEDEVHRHGYRVDPRGPR